VRRTPIHNISAKACRRRQTRRHARSARRKALTIVETLVTLSVISLLAALLLPAVQAARESARRGQCLNNLREIVVACAAHESARQAFPYTSVNYLGSDKIVHPACSPHERLLPYLEQGPVYGQIDFGDLPLDISTDPPSSMNNGRLVPLALGVFRCPTDSGLPGGNNYRACMGFGPGIFTAAETSVCTDAGNASGAFVNSRSVTPAEFLDGLSATVMFSERVMGSRGAYRPFLDYRVYLGNICSVNDAMGICSSLAVGPTDSNGGSTWLFGGWRQTWYNHVLTPNSRIPDCNSGPLSSGGGNGAYTARSYHPGGVNSAMADGSARFVSEDVDILVWRAISTRRGGEAQSL
jgi:prepilin-type processing-associated H-X9-DG protein